MGRRGLGAAIFAIVSLFGAGTGTARAQLFIEGLTTPRGIATDLAGNVYVHSDFPPVTTRVTKWSAAAQFLGSGGEIGGFNPFEYVGSHLDPNPLTGGILLLSPQGVILRIDAATLAAAPAIDLRPLAGTVADNVFDIVLRSTRSVVVGAPTYGDLAVRSRPGGGMDLFATAITSAGGFPLVVRVRTDAAGNVIDIRFVLTSSSTVTGLQVNTPQGIAVNANGTVLTSLAITDGATNLKALAAFSADFPETGVGLPDVLVDGIGRPLDASTAGMTTDSRGNFYVATDVVGARLCGVGASGSLLFLNRTLTTIACLPSGVLLTRPGDVAIAPNDSVLYLTDDNLVLGFALSPTSTSTTMGSPSSTTTTTTTLGAQGSTCGDVNGDLALSAGDALAVLSASLGAGACVACVCDANGDGATTASDALLVLRAALGISVALDCPLC